AVVLLLRGRVAGRRTAVGRAAGARRLRLPGLGRLVVLRVWLLLGRRSDQPLTGLPLLLLELRRRGRRGGRLLRGRRGRAGGAAARGGGRAVYRLAGGGRGGADGTFDGGVAGHVAPVGDIGVVLHLRRGDVLGGRRGAEDAVLALGAEVAG